MSQAIPTKPIPLHRVPLTGTFEVLTPPGNRFQRVGVTECKPLINDGDLNFPKGTVHLTENLLVRQLTGAVIY